MENFTITEIGENFITNNFYLKHFSLILFTNKLRPFKSEVVASRHDFSGIFPQKSILWKISLERKLLKTSKGTTFIRNIFV